jgi:hypothetical protein
MINKPSSEIIDELNLEEKIRTLLSESIVYFDYKEMSDMQVELLLVTISKSHGQKFLFHKCLALSKFRCLLRMVEYIESDYKKNLLHYSIEWSHRGKTSISWFNGRSYLDIMDKFYYAKDPGEIVIFRTELKPIS